MQKTINCQKGFAALISAILVSAVLLVLAAPLARAAFWARFEMLDRENKKIALARAEGCVEQALLGIAKNEIVATWDKCENLEIGGSNPYIVTARANWKNSYVNLKVEVEKNENGEIKITNWEEF